MFTGIIQHLGSVISVEPSSMGAVLRVNADGWTHLAVAASGESIAVNGCCLTLALDESADLTTMDSLRFDVIPQTLRMTTLRDLRAGDAVNLERSVTPTTLMGGHIMQGHVDGVGLVREAIDSGSERRMRISPPLPLMEFIVDKGSIAVDGVSLTVASVGKDWLEVALIPTTLSLTNLGGLKPDSRVNLETDCIVKTVVSWLKKQQSM